MAARVHKATVEGGISVGLLQQGQHGSGVQLPPPEQEVRVHLALVGRHGVTFDLTSLGIVGVVPWLYFAQEVNNFCVMAVPAQKRTCFIKSVVIVTNHYLVTTRGLFIVKLSSTSLQHDLFIVRQSAFIPVVPKLSAIVP